MFEFSECFLPNIAVRGHCGVSAGQTEGDIGYHERDFYDMEYDSASGQFSTPLITVLLSATNISISTNNPRRE